MPTLPNPFDNLSAPRLNDEAVVELHEFLIGVLNRFDSLYGAQIYRYYEQRSHHNLLLTENPQLDLPFDDPPF